jgi:hypothetical protein
MPYAIAWRGQNPYQVLPEPLAQSYPWLNEHTVGTVYFGGWDPRIFTEYPGRGTPKKHMSLILLDLCLRKRKK